MRVGILTRMANQAASKKASSKRASSKAVRPKRTSPRVDDAPFEVIGVYKWPVTIKAVKALAKTLYGTANARSIAACKKQLASVAVIELHSKQLPRGFDAGDIAQVPPGKRDGNEQVPYDERFWTGDGKSELGFSPPAKGPLRIVFFQHFFDKKAPLYLGNGVAIPLPRISKLPTRLKARLTYEAP